MSLETVVLKGNRDGIVIAIDPAASFEDIVPALKQKFTETKRILYMSKITVSFEGKLLSEEEENILKDTICQNVLRSTKVEFITPDTNSGLDEKKQDLNTRFYHGIVRSGQVFSSDGHIVVIGDINPGGELIAGGNIIVMGNLKGTARAGEPDNEKAFVAAVDLSPTQIRIAGLLARSPDHESKREIVPEIAFIKDSEIVIDKYLNKIYKM